MGSAGIGNHPPLVVLVGSVVAPGAAALVALAALLVVLMAVVSALGAASDRPGAGAGLGCVAFGVQLHHHPGAEGGVVLGPAHPLGQLPTGSCPGGDGAAVSVTKTGSRLGVAGRLLRWRAASTARWRTASGLRAGMPSPWRVKALRSDGQVVPSYLPLKKSRPG